MNCEDYLIMIDDLVEGELEAREAEQVNLHLFACPDCSVYHEVLREEKALYAQVLFDAEPAADLPLKFLAALKEETREEASKPIAAAAADAAPGWFWKLQNIFRFSPSVAFASLLILFVLGFLLLNTISQKTDESLAENKPDAQKTSTLQETKTPDIAANGDDVEKFSSPKVDDKKIPVVSVRDRNKVDAKTIAANTKPASQKKIIPAKPPLSAEELQIAKLKKIETETAKQVEKIEMLLRSFRNAQALENGELYDVAYEKQQARKLLEKNAQIRQTLGKFGALYPDDLLSQAEPLLLEIANLGASPSPEKVLEIKERLSNKNIIASLQAY